MPRAGNIIRLVNRETDEVREYELRDGSSSEEVNGIVQDLRAHSNDTNDLRTTWRTISGGLEIPDEPTREEPDGDESPVVVMRPHDYGQGTVTHASSEEPVSVQPSFGDTYYRHFRRVSQRLMREHGTPSGTDMSRARPTKFVMHFRENIVGFYTVMNYARKLNILNDEDMRYINSKTGFKPDHSVEVDRGNKAKEVKYRDRVLSGATNALEALLECDAFRRRIPVKRLFIEYHDKLITWKELAENTRRPKRDPLPKLGYR